MKKKFHIIRKIEPKQMTFRVDKVISMFDLNLEKYKEEFKGEINLDKKWDVGLIVGRSGTGKTTIAKELFGIFDDFNFGENPIIEEMPKSRTVDEIIKTFTLVGFSSPPSWLKPYKVLSQGEKMRVNLAKALLSDKKIIVFDEFTSVVDRDVAKIICMVIKKAIKKLNKKFIAISCHYDIIDWLEPDWIFNTDEMKFEYVKKNAQNWKSKFISQKKIIGQYLGNIII